MGEARLEGTLCEHTEDAGGTAVLLRGSLQGVKVLVEHKLVPAVYSLLGFALSPPADGRGGISALYSGFKGSGIGRK